MKMYKYLSKFNDIKAISKGRIFQRLWNKKIMSWVMTVARRFMK